MEPPGKIDEEKIPTSDAALRYYFRVSFQNLIGKFFPSA